MDYPVETFTDDERALLRAHVTNLDQPVFALVNLPETLKGALFARYSRYPGTLRRLLLDEFAADLPGGDEAAAGAGGDSSRAAQLYERIFLGYGDDSVAQLGGAHVACEWVSNVLTKVLQRPRLGAYLEQSTRYIAYDAPMPGGGAPGADAPRYRYYRDAELGPAYTRAMDELFATYSAALPQVVAWAQDEFPRTDDDAPAAHARALKAKALDLLRGLLPASSLSHMGIFATGQTYEQLILHLLAHPLPEARHYGAMILQELQKVMPSFVARVDRPDRGGQWIGYLQSRAEAGARWARRLGLEEDAAAAAGPSVRLTHVDGDEDDLLVALMFEASATSEDAIRRSLEGLPDAQRAQLLSDLIGERANRRHRPGRGFEALRYRFEIVADYGAFRDLQRHRMLSMEWQPLGISLGYDMPELVVDAGLDDRYAEAIGRAEELYRSLRPDFPEQASYVVALAHRIRYVMQFNAREAMHLIELRSGAQGHPAYRRVAQQMHRAIAEVAGHRALAEAMTFVDHGATDLERLESERRAERRRTEKSATH